MFEAPTQLINWEIALEAIDDDRNMARAYRISASRDLFGNIIVDLRWGRIGRRGAGLIVSFAQEEAAQRFIQRTLAKRASASRRIGVAYAVRSTTVAPPTRSPEVPSREAQNIDFCQANYATAPMAQYGRLTDQKKIDMTICPDYTHCRTMQEQTPDHGT
jgi:predicted DNA-binding WGR domain protein